MAQFINAQEVVSIKSRIKIDNVINALNRKVKNAEEQAGGRYRIRKAFDVFDELDGKEFEQAKKEARSAGWYMNTSVTDFGREYTIEKI